MEYSGKTLAVIGASYLQLPLVQKARDLEVRTLCFAWEEGAVCRAAADQFFPVSILEKEEILAICRREKIDGIVTIASDAAVPTVNFVAEKLQLPGNSVLSGKLSTDKFAMRQALRNAGVNCPDFHAFRTLQEGLSAAEKLSLPVILKPCDRSGSMGVARLTSAGEIPGAAEKALAASFTHTGIMEQWVDFNQEISVEGISSHGQYHPLAVTAKVTSGPPHYVELGHHQPASLPPELEKEVFRQVRLGIDALNITTGASHAELMITRDGTVFVTEIGARMGGDFIGSDLVELSTGYDFLRGVIECAFDTFSGVHQNCKNAAGVWFYTRHTPGVKTQLDNRDQHPYIRRGEYDRNAELPPLTRSADRSGYMIYQITEDAELLPQLRSMDGIS